MQMSGEERIAAPRQLVWESLNDPEILRQCIPGCESVTKTSDTTFEAAVTAKIGPVKARFKGKVALSDLDPPNGYTISGEGQGGVAGFGKGSAKVTLTDEGKDTLLKYSVDAQIGGKLAQIGSRLVDAAAGGMAAEFFAKFNAVVAGAPAGAGAAADITPSPSAGGNANRSGLPPWLWVGGLIVIVVGVLYYFVGR